MKKLFKDPGIQFALGILGASIAIPSENSYVRLILIPVSFLLEFIGLFGIIKNYLNEKKNIKQGKENTTDSSYIKPDISIWMSLLAAFGSLFAVVSSLVLLLFLEKGNLDMFRYFIIAISCIHVVIVVISFIAFFKILANKRQNKSLE